MGRKSTLREYDGLDLLTRHHDAIRQLFRNYERLLMKRQGDQDRKAEIVGQICFRLSIHLQIEEEIFFPAAQVALGKNALISRALFDHGGIKELIAELDEMEPADSDFDATVGLLEACVVPNMNDEQEDIFPKVRMAGLNTVLLGRQMAQRQRALHEDVTHVGLPHSKAGAVTWPVDCRVVIT